LTYLIICGSHPFEAKGKDELFELIIAGKVEFGHKIWLRVSESAKDFIKKCLIVD